MKNYILSIVLLLISNAICAQDYTLIVDKSNATWTGYGEVGGFYQTGTLAPESSQISIQDGIIESGELIFNLRNLKHEDKNLENHLKAKDFFHTKKYPRATFRILRQEGSKIIGNLNIRGITKEVAINFGTKSINDLLLIEGKAEIDRTAFEIKYNSSSYFQDLGSYAIKNNFDLEFKLYYQQEEEN